MQIKLKYFGEVAELIKVKDEVLDVQTSNLNELTALVEKRYNINLQNFTCALNHKIISDKSVKIKDKDEIAFLSQFAGG